MKGLFFALIVFVALPAFAQKDFSIHYADLITPTALKSKLSAIASPSMEGRETATPGQRKAAIFIENSFKKSGLLPPTSAGYQMRFTIHQDTVLRALLQVNNKDFLYGQSFSIRLGQALGASYNINEIQFIGEGDSATIARIDLKDKWVMLQRDNPDSLLLVEKVLKRKGIKGYFKVTNVFSPADKSMKGDMYLEDTSITLIPCIKVSNDVASEILKKLIASSWNLSNIKTGTYATNIHFAITKKTLLFETSNVIGVLPGGDLKDEYVLLTAHYDHLGVHDHLIYYGADDNGSGTISVLQLAEAFAKAKTEGHGPRRTVVFMAVSGEEQGIFGSEFYVEHPAYPLAKTSVDLNIDMVGRTDPDRINIDSPTYIYTIGENKVSSDLIPITNAIKKKYSKVDTDRRFDRYDPERFFSRSDHYNFAKMGVPIIFYFNGTHADYHKPTDTIDKINFDLMTKRVKLIFHTAWVMANRDDMLKRDLPL